MKTLHSLSWARKSVYSALIFFGTLIVLSVGYSAWNATMSKVSSGNPLSAAGWNALVDNIADLDSRWSWSGGNLVFTGGNVGIGTVSPGQSVLDVRRTNESYGQSAIIATQSNVGTSGGMPSFIRAAITGVGYHNYTAPSNWNTGILGWVPGGGHQATAGIFYTPEWNGTDYTTLGRVVRLIGAPASDEVFVGRINQSDQSTNRADFVINGGGTVGVGTTPSGTYRLEINGTAAGTSWTNLSDQRFKKNITPLSSALDTVGKLQGVTFDWRVGEFKDRNFPEGKQVGFIAQEVEKVIPEVVTTDKQGYKGVEYANITAVLVEAVKELSHKIDALFAKYVDQQKEIDSLKARLDRLEQK